MANETKVHVSNNGVGFLGLLTVLLAAGKIFGFQDYSWWVVFAPIWVGIAIVLVIIAVFLIGAAVADFFGARSRRKRRKKAGSTKDLHRTIDRYSDSINSRR